jgi:hypothetical protein
MKKTVIILSVFALIVFGCKPRTTPSTTPQADTLNIQQELPQEEINNDLLEKQQLEDEFNAYPLVSAEEIAMIAPVIKKWTDFYSIDFAQARLVNVRTECFNCTPTLETQGINFRGEEISEEEDTDERIDADYSPDKQLYVCLGLILEKIDDKYYHIGWDDSQNVWLFDRKQKYANSILFHGSHGRSEASFWKSNDVFMIVSYVSIDKPVIRYYIDVFDITKQTQTTYQIMREEEDSFFGYMDEVYLKEKGIIVD